MSERRAAVVTGGASGIGRATVERFLADGWSVVVADLGPGLGVAGQVFETGHLRQKCPDGTRVHGVDPDPVGRELDAVVRVRLSTAALAAE